MITMKCLCRETCDSQGSCVEDYKFLDDDGTVSMETYNPCQVKFLLLFYIVKIILQFTDKKPLTLTSIFKPGCACPRDKPVFNNGECITRDQCKQAKPPKINKDNVSVSKSPSEITVSRHSFASIFFANSE